MRMLFSIIGRAGHGGHQGGLLKIIFKKARELSQYPAFVMIQLEGKGNEAKRSEGNAGER